MENYSKMMQCLKAVIVVLVCSVLLTQIHCASLHPQNSQLVRQKRMTPFWREMLRPLGAPCRNNNDCITRICRNHHCSLRTAQK
ncbi:liver-expressed antimicrobial peptide 2 [Hemicordylus capensis]|uniref:liver-expressed antimicrobial peptide 2 n=1 Tax=Hemicordylus capensis TaxID=884348 RepID=UPI002303F84F|nr:liver-expressed antimicrobial peptide 2 [Hemicordylus capensis]